MKTGDKVVCISANPTRWPEDFKTVPVKGQIYVVRGFDYSPITGDQGIYLVGIKGPWHPIFKMERGFYAHHFRKLDEMKEESRLRKENRQPVGAPIATPVSQK